MFEESGGIKLVCKRFFDLVDTVPGVLVAGFWIASWLELLVICR